MGKKSIKENKTEYQKCREELKLTRDAASEILPGITPDRIAKIEGNKKPPHPEEVKIMAEGYKNPYLCNYYCSKVCAIGKSYVPEIKDDPLNQTVLEIINALNSMNSNKDRLINIALDGKITDDEIEDFIKIQEILENISKGVESLQLWAEQKLANGEIDKEDYDRYKKSNK